MKEEDRKKLTHPELQAILWDYTNWLHKLGYTDSDFYTEEPYAVDRYLDEGGGTEFFNKMTSSSD